MSETTNETAPALASVEEQRDLLLRLAIFALSQLKAPGSGMMFNSRNTTLKHWELHFIDELKRCGVEVDADLVTYNKASKADRATMRKDPAFAAKLEATK